MRARYQRLATAVAAVAVLMTAPAAAQTAAGNPADCDALSAVEIEGYDLQVESAAHVEDENGRHCLLMGSFEHRTGAEEVDYAIGFGLALPDDWNGRFLFQGGGGLNGMVRPPVGAAAAGDRSALARGFAVVSTDSGHRGEVFDASFKKDQMAVLNFAHGSVEKVTEVARRIVDRHYGRSPDYSYFAGCSTGGREGMIAAQRFPALFDGIISGAPAIRTDRSNMSLARKNVAMNRLSPAGADGAPDRAAVFGQEDRDTILAGILDACDGLDGAEDGMIFNAGACSFDPSSLTCEGGRNEGCLSTEQAQLVAEMFAPTANAGGSVAYPAFPPDTGVVSDADNIPGLLRFDDQRNRQFRNHATEFDVDAEVDAVDADPHQRLINTDQWTDLGSFAAQGSKMIFFHGMSDPWFSANDTIDYFGKMTEVTSARAPADEWTRLYLVPGMAHCRGGPGGLDEFDMLTPLVEWVEEGAAPAEVIATGTAFPGRSRPLCPYPAYAHHSGEGDMEAAESFECRQ